MPPITNQYLTIIPHVIIIMPMTNVSTFNERCKLGMTLKPELRTYIKSKKQFETEQYIKFCVSCLKRSLLAQFRMGVLPLAIETGRFKSIPVEESVCVLY